VSSAGAHGIRARVSLSTAKTHVGRLLMKLGARDRAQLVIAVYNTGLVGPP
jgi:DNA-binding NarL/FixJ family response regulator